MLPLGSLILKLLLLLLLLPAAVVVIVPVGDVDYHYYIRFSVSKIVCTLNGGIKK